MDLSFSLQYAVGCNVDIPPKLCTLECKTRVYFFAFDLSKIANLFNI